MAQYKKLFEKTSIGKMNLRNRIVMPPMCTNFADPTRQNCVTKQMIDYYAERAKGGVGLITVEFSFVSQDGQALISQHGIYSDRHIAGLNMLAETIKECGAKSTIQIHHAGREAFYSVTGSPALAPSAIPTSGEVKAINMPVEMTLDDIERIQNDFVNAAIRVKAAGFNAVTIHGSHGYLISQFLSPDTNRRTDYYGGDLVGRTNFAVQIVKRIREEVGPDFPIIFRMNGDDMEEGGLTLEESTKIAKILEEVSIDAIDMSAGRYQTYHKIVSPMYYPTAYLTHLSKEIKKNVNIPVIVANRINDPEVAEEILQSGKADLIAIGRGLFADSEFPNKASKGNVEDIRKCIGCNFCIGIRCWSNHPMKCTVNAELGKEDEYKIKKVTESKKVFIIGGGPAGMEAARVLALRGHEVTLYDKNKDLGGQLLVASIPSFKQDLLNLVNYLSRQMKKLDINLECGKEVTPEIIKAANPDAVIVAIGASTLVPEIPGVENAISAIDVHKDQSKIGEKIVVVGGGMVGTETAVFLAQQGKKVTIVEMLEAIAIDLNPISRPALLEMVNDNGVEVFTNFNVEEITSQGVIVSDKEWKKKKIDADTVVLAVGFKPNNKLLEELEQNEDEYELYAIGDCVEVGKIDSAIHQAAFIARQI